MNRKSISMKFVVLKFCSNDVWKISDFKQLQEPDALTNPLSYNMNEHTFTIDVSMKSRSRLSGLNRNVMWSKLDIEMKAMYE